MLSESRRFRRPPARWWRALVAAVLALPSWPSGLHAAAAWVDLGDSDVVQGLANVQRGDDTDGENDAATCGPAGSARAARMNRGDTDDDYPDVYLYFVVTDTAVKASPRLRIAVTLYDDPAFAVEPVQLALHYTNAASSGPGDLANTFAASPRTWTLSGTGQWVRHVWSVADAGFRTFMQGSADFRFDARGGRVCVDRVDVAVDDPPPPDAHLVGAHYYPWYDTARWSYGECYAGALRLELSPAQQPKLGRYDSSRPSVVDQHLRWCAEYGVNVLILEFIAPGGREDRICREVVLAHARSADVRFAVMYDWAIRFNNRFALTAELIETARADFDHLAREYFARPTYLTIAGGRPLAMIYVTRALSGDVAGLIGTLREVCAARGFDVFLAGDEFFFPSAPKASKIERWDGIFGYDVYAGRGGYWATNGNLELFRTRTREYREAANAAGVVFFPSCAPGFNDRAIRRTCADNPAFPRKVAAGDDFTSLFRETFARTALTSVDAQAPLVAITSFNEWHEDTQIEPTGGTAPATSTDTSASGSQYTQGFEYDDYGTAHLELIRSATIAVTGRVRGPSGPTAGATVEVLDGDAVVLVRTAFTTGVYTVPRLRLTDGAPYRLHVAAAGVGEALSPAFTPRAGETITGFDVTLVPPEVFRRGDANADGAIDIADAIFTLSYLFAQAAPPACLDAADANDSGTLDIADAITTLSHLFAHGGDLPAPFGACGTDPTADEQDCGSFAPCG